MKRALLLAVVAVFAISGCGKKRDENTGSAPAPVVDNHRHVLSGKDIAFVKNQLEELNDGLTSELALSDENKEETAKIAADLKPVAEALTKLYMEVLGENPVDETKEYSVKHEQDEAFEANAKALEALVIRFNELKGQTDETRIEVKPAPAVEPAAAPEATEGAPAGEEKAPEAAPAKPATPEQNTEKKADGEKAPEAEKKAEEKPATEKTDSEEKPAAPAEDKKDGEAPKTDAPKSDETQE